MKAIIYQHYGPPEVLQPKDVSKPEPKDHEVLIRVRAAEVTKGDCELRSFKFPVKWFWLPLRIGFGIFRPRRKILGAYFSGEVEAIGKQVTKFKVGDQLFGTTKLRFGTYAEYVCLPENYTLVKKPTNLSFEEAATVPLGGLNALHFMRLANIQSGDKVLINGAGGSIGTFAVQIAKVFAAEVTAVDSPIKKSMLLTLGADHFIDYTREDFKQSKNKYDVIFDMVASSSLEESIACLNSNGRYITANPTLKKMLSAGRIFKQTGKKVIFAFAGELTEELQTLKDMIEAGTIRPVVDKVFPMNQAVEAHRRVEAEERLGIVVLSIS